MNWSKPLALIISGAGAILALSSLVLFAVSRLPLSIVIGDMLVGLAVFSFGLLSLHYLERNPNMKSFLTTVAMVIAFSSHAQSQNKDTNTSQPSGKEQAVIQAERNMLNAYAQGDSKTLERLLADDLTDTSSNGSVATKQDILKSVKPNSNLTFDISRLKARVYGDAGVITGILAVKLKEGDKEMTEYYQVTNTFIKRKNAWRIVASQQNLIPVWQARNLEDSELKPVMALDCGQESSLKSLNGDVATYIRFTNSTAQPVIVHWLNYEGKRDPSEDQKQTLKPGQSDARFTYLTHPFMVTAADGKCLGIYQPTREPSLVVVK